MARKLTALQVETLIAVSKGEVVSRNVGYSAFRIQGASPTSVGRLVSLGLVRWTDCLGGDARLTEEGEQALAEATTQQVQP